VGERGGRTFNIKRQLNLWWAGRRGNSELDRKCRFTEGNDSAAVRKGRGKQIRLVLSVLIFGMLISISGCSSGKDFTRPNFATLLLGKTTEGQIRRQFGNPQTEGTVVRNEANLKTLSYDYAESAPYVEKISARHLVFWFYEGSLVGYNYQSSFSGDKTDFDESVLDQIRNGVTSTKRLVELLGLPTGELIYPLIKTKDGRAYVYSYMRADRPYRRNLQIRSKTLTVTFDGFDRVTEVNLSTSGPFAPR
jgi:hypothetical protein